MSGDATARRSRWLIRFIGLGLLIGVIAYAGVEPIYRTMREANPWWLLAGFVFNIPQLGIKAFRWYLTVRWQGIRFTFRQAFLAYFGVLLIGFMTPGRLGELAKAFVLQRETNVSLGRAFSSVVLDRIFDLYLLVILGILGIFHFALIGKYMSAWAFAGLCIVFFMPILFLKGSMVRRAGAAIVNRPVFRGKSAPLTAKIEDFATGLEAMSPVRIGCAALLTCASYSIFFFQTWCCMRALHFTMAPIDMILLTAVTNLIGFIPISISNLGTREATLTAFFTGILEPRLPAPLAVSWGLAQFVVLFVGGGVIGFICWQVAPPAMRKAMDDVTAAGSQR